MGSRNRSELAKFARPQQIAGAILCHPLVASQTVLLINHVALSLKR
jgi:hypothetical protein